MSTMERSVTVHYVRNGEALQDEYIYVTVAKVEGDGTLLIQTSTNTERLVNRYGVGVWTDFTDMTKLVEIAE